MNKTQIKSLESVKKVLEEQKDRLSTIVDDCQDKYDNASENWQEGEKGEALNDQIDAVQSIVDDLDINIASIDEIIENNEA